jgi:hypothetical protein
MHGPVGAGMHKNYNSFFTGIKQETNRQQFYNLRQFLYRHETEQIGNCFATSVLLPWDAYTPFISSSTKQQSSY